MSNRRIFILVSVFTSFTILFFPFATLIKKFVGIPNNQELIYNATRRVKVTDVIVKEVLKEAQNIANFLAQQDKFPEKVDLLMVLGSSDLKVAYRAAEIYKQTYVEKILISGGGFIGNKKEAMVFKEILINQGVSEEAILIEDESRHTGENMEFSVKALKEKGISPESVLLLQTPLFQRRSKAYFHKYFPETIKLYSFAPYIPDLGNLADEEKLRKTVLALREIYRFLTWGPSGKNIIPEVPVPPEILKASRIILGDLKDNQSKVFEVEPWLNELYQILQMP